MTDYTRYVENRLEQFKLNDDFAPILLAWIERNIHVTVHGDIEDPEVEVEWK